MSLLLFLAFAMQTNTTCHTVGGTTRCTTDSGSIWSDFIRGQQEEQARQTEERNRQNEASNERRARAYEQVGALIADGKCEEAKRLAKFYDKPDIIKDTARACP